MALQFGLGITVLAYMTAHSSGGHINFAVSLTAETLPRTLPALRPRSAMRMPDLAGVSARARYAHA